MKLRSGLAGVGAAMVFALAAQAAQASTQQCPEGGGGAELTMHEVPADSSCQPSGGHVPLDITVDNANDIAYNVEAEVENGDELLAPGTVIEVEIEYDDVVASLKANEDEAVMLAAALGMRPNETMSKTDLVDVANTPVAMTGKLTESELKMVAEHVHASLQSRGRTTGRSDPANSWTSRIQATGQAISRAFSSIGRNIPSMDIGFQYRSYDANGTLRSETTIGARVRRANQTR